MTILKYAKTVFLAALVAVFSISFSSCESFFEEEGDCTPIHKIRFVYDMNLKWADAFPSEVHSVDLFVFDEDGKYVKTYYGRGDEVDQPGYEIILDVPAGKPYTFVAWCGLYNEGAKEESFSVTECKPGETTVDELLCWLNALSAEMETRAGENEEMVKSDKQLYFLYHGLLENEMLEDQQRGETYVHTVYLTKDTNHIRIILQELTSNTDMSPNDYTFSIEDADGVMAYNNAVVSDTKIEYTPWSQVSDEIGVGRVDVNNGEINYVRGVIADLSVSRLLASHKNKLFLTITNANNNEVIARVPLLQYALLARPYYESAYGHNMTDQEFLDREDEYEMTFFLYNNRWMNAYIDILSWRIVLHDYELQ